ncbi:rhomboid-like protein [Mycobacterium camsae]|uniref:rhomboid-like protein n=1 Tax=Mycobacterium gordonae TaxID=1778 RepID=UPI001F11F2D4|nr:rhomboid-like protein [Mycobacterium gordonae]
MTASFFTRLSRVRFTVAYVAALFAVSVTMLMLSPQAHDRVIRHASTNLHNLSHGRLGTLIGSAFVVEAGPLWFWLPFLTCLLVLAELHLHTIRLLVAFFVGHIGATLVVAAALAMAVKMGWMPWSITRVSDVGMSYGALAALGALTATIPPRLRWGWIGWWISVSVAAAVIGGEFTNAGHAVAVTLGVLVSFSFRAPIHWTPARCLMLLGSAGFGFLMLVHSIWGMAGGAVFGLTGALLAHLVARRFGHRPAPNAAPVTARAVSNRIAN